MVIPVQKEQLAIIDYEIRKLVGVYMRQVYENYKKNNEIGHDVHHEIVVHGYTLSGVEISISYVLDGGEMSPPKHAHVNWADLNIEFSDVPVNE